MVLLPSSRELSLLELIAESEGVLLVDAGCRGCNVLEEEDVSSIIDLGTAAAGLLDVVLVDAVTDVPVEATVMVSLLSTLLLV